MSFPFDTSDQTPDYRGLFLVQVPALRERILPLFSFDPNAADERPVGHGTAFRIDPWSRCATAFHVLSDLFQVDAAGKAISLRDNLRLAALEVDGRSYGILPIPDDGWRPMAGSYSWFRIDKPFAQPASLRNLVELMLLRIRPPEMPETGTPLPAREAARRLAASRRPGYGARLRRPRHATQRAGGSGYRPTRSGPISMPRSARSARSSRQSQARPTMARPAHRRQLARSHERRPRLQ